MSKRGLGKGLDALLSTSSLAREKQQSALHSQELSSDGELTDLSINSLKPGVYQPRKDMEPEALEELAASIESQGIIQPIVVRQVENDKFEIIAGERRWRAARKAGLKQVPCVIKNVDDRAAIAMALIENIQREDLNVIEEAVALDRLQEEFSLTHQQVAEVIGKSRATVSNLLRLNQLEMDVKYLLSEKMLEMGHARALLALEGEEQVEVAELVAKKRMTVRQTEQLVKKCLQPQSEEKNELQDTEAQQMSQKLSEMLSAKVAIVRTKNGASKVTISLDEPHKLEQLIAKLEG
ncbi:chromosome partitioning protein ParB [Vibrio coralliilyticus]|jgi:ParB family chromosome partitioning protein|uniref:Probable chromosome-partitioning protein ParB n=1 Tax=Vibrio coralliilyticus TaxID=190893 RepID=A0A7Y4BSB9_9VIBR|nr:ParB/RepB/Spo0J family partition protein [Vibrio coralliilyticus]KJY68644.1 chromosome partitioning protein ParB [Vibrio coralliilyticus]NOH55912.1 ParB/RepB/Spo0J family partition protein [Vibrio coralliilyticus]NOI31780.1 ParB/RepB/Spo0J family partition protein [Vibrio coralliilyticus]NOI51129.1 ParB/RepB/Spo0J family partition protein [Vibrio coralliilyticus]NOJ25513.1 ParB/RepB/Spo0J family partition protein [Vibrio coralliilyticus]